jgi:hypothetical protein
MRWITIININLPNVTNNSAYNMDLSNATNDNNSSGTMDNMDGAVAMELNEQQVESMDGSSTPTINDIINNNNSIATINNNNSSNTHQV